MESSEEKYPLLLLYAEDGTRKADLHKKSFSSDNKRSSKILQGATTIITQWPGHMTSCWIMAVCLALLLILTTMFISYSFQVATFHNHMQPKCIFPLPQQFNNKTVHIVHDGNNWSDNQLDVLQYIINVYKDYTVHISIFEMKIHNETRQTDNDTTIAQSVTITPTTKITNEKRNNNSLFTYDGQLDTIQFFENLKKTIYRNIKTIQEEQKITFDSVINSSNVIVNKYFYDEYLENTPLQYDLEHFDTNMLTFACRINEMWQYGGLSFYLPLTSNLTNITKTSNGSDVTEPTDVEIKSYILASKSILENLPRELVSIDRRGLHMASQILCHSFFGELIMKISSDRFSKTPQIFIEETLQEFCKRRAVSEEDCKVL